LFTPGTLVDGARKALRDILCPYTNRMDDALRVIRAAVEYGRILEAPRLELQAPLYVEEVEQRLAALPNGMLTEPEAKSLLRAGGIGATPEVRATSEEEAVTAADRLGYPVVLKAVCRGLVHKSDIGAVKLDLVDRNAVRGAFRDIAASIARHMPTSKLDGCVVQPMVISGVELILGTKWDPQFGAVVMVGAGGTLVEIINDVALAVAPLTHHRAQSLLQGLQVWPRLTGARGRAPGDLDALVDALVRLSWIAYVAGPRLIELDVNPLLVQQKGVLALDARATIAPAARGDPCVE
jgi:acetyl-CoA synthetase (ADP-forming)